MSFNVRYTKGAREDIKQPYQLFHNKAISNEEFQMKNFRNKLR
jgi:hypothetical protein